jgi:cytochrome d ubiquinol oxidase subunit II
MIQLIFDYTTLRLIWWVLLGVLLIGFAATDGFDMGVGALLPFVARTDSERRVVINTVGPVWEGNQVWFILGGGAIFAAWPALYALSFSGFYLAMFLVLFALILRPVGFKYRSKRASVAWRRNWDWALFVGGAVPSLIFGVAVGNALKGVPFHFTDDLRPIYEGNLFGLLLPLALYCGLVSLSMLVTHGAAWLSFKAEGPVADRAAAIGSKTALITAVLFAGGGVLIWLGAFGGYQVTSPIVWDGPSNPLCRISTPCRGSWPCPRSAWSRRCWRRQASPRGGVASPCSSPCSGSPASSPPSGCRCFRSSCRRAPTPTIRSPCSTPRRAVRRFATC